MFGVLLNKGLRRVGTERARTFKKPQGCILGKRNKHRMLVGGLFVSKAWGKKTSMYLSRRMDGFLNMYKVKYHAVVKMAELNGAICSNTDKSQKYTRVKANKSGKKCTT